MKEMYGIDMETSQHSKLISDIPVPDIVIKMGCNVSCPVLPATHVEDWGLDDPTGQSDEVFKKDNQSNRRKDPDSKGSD